MPLHGHKLPAHPPSTVVAKRGRELGQLLERQSRISSPGGLQYGPMGPNIAVERRLSFIGVAVSNISARVGTTMGIGQVQIVQPQGTWDAHNNLTNMQGTQLTAPTYWVSYASSKTMTSGNGIDSGMYCAVEEDMFGTLWAAPLDCA